jgi:hypothetical protein
VNHLLRGMLSGNRSLKLFIHALEKPTLLRCFASTNHRTHPSQNLCRLLCDIDHREQQRSIPKEIGAAALLALSLAR